MTFNRLALVGERGAADAFAFVVPALLLLWALALVLVFMDDERDAAAAVEIGGVPRFPAPTPEPAPLNGGIGWMNIEMRFGAPLSFPDTEDVLVSAAGAFAPAGWGDAALGIFAVAGATAPEREFEEASLPLPAVVVSVEGPMTRACPDSASLVAFSRIWRCLSSSFARIVTRSSGIGLFSCVVVVMVVSYHSPHDRPNLNLRSTHLERLTELHQLRHTLVHLILDQRMLLPQQPVLLRRDKVPESGHRVGRGLCTR